MLKRMKKNKKGFTLAELLIVVAIIGVLVSISIPIFTAQLKKARLATNQANARSAYAAAAAAMLESDNNSTTFTYTVNGGKITPGGTQASGNTDIASWTVNTQVNGVNLGDDVAKTWYITFDSTSVKGIGAAK